MDKTLKAFYNGKLTPWDERRPQGIDEVHAVKELSDAGGWLAQSLPPDLRPTLGRLMKAQEILDGIVAETNYIDGFKPGARFMMDILDDTRENLKPVT